MYIDISELYVRYIAISQIVCVNENSTSLAFLYRLKNLIDFPSSYQIAIYNNDPLNLSSLLLIQLLIPS
jgi:hypothetical protein